MRRDVRTRLQLIAAAIVAVNCIIYFLYINGIIELRTFSIADLNPYGGWSHLKAGFTDVSYRWRGITRGMALTIGITLAAIISGRVFCGYVCPIGLLQDVSNHLGRKMGINSIKSSKLTKGFEKTKYIVFLAVVILGIFGLGNLLTPLSPWLRYLNIFAGMKLQTGLILLVLVLLLSLKIKRPFCRFMCPLGAYQALLSAIGSTSIKDSGNCDSCSYCLRDCPVGIESFDDGSASPECIGCMRCIESNCIKGNNGYSIWIFNRPAKGTSIVIISLAILILSYSTLPIIGATQNTTSRLPVGELKDGSYVGIGTGFGGPLLAEIDIVGGKVSNISVVSHRETTGYYEEVFRFVGSEIVAAQSISIDAISGATATTRGFLGAVRSGISQASALD